MIILAFALGLIGSYVLATDFMIKFSPGWTRVIIMSLTALLLVIVSIICSLYFKYLFEFVVTFSVAMLGSFHGMNLKNYVHFKVN